MELYLEAARDAYERAGLPAWMTDVILDKLGEEFKHAAVLPSLSDWKEGIEADARRTAHFVLERNRWDPELGWWALSDVCAFWHCQFPDICRSPFLLCLPPKDRCGVGKRLLLQ